MIAVVQNHVFGERNTRNLEEIKKHSAENRIVELTMGAFSTPDNL